MSGYIGNVPVPQSTQNRQDFVATAGQTVFNTLGYEPKYVDVYLNGIKLIDITEYTATNGTDIILTSAASAGDTLSYLSFTNFSIIDSVGDLAVTNLSTETLEVGGSGVTIDAILDEDDMVSNSDTAVSTQQSVKVYVDTSVGNIIIDEDNMVSNSDTTVPTQQSVKTYVDTSVSNIIIDEDNMISDSDTVVPTQQSVKAYVDTSIDNGITSVIIDEDDMVSNSDTEVPTQQSVKTYVDTSVSNIIIDEDNMASDSATAVPTQQSTKAYVDTSIVNLEASKLGLVDNATGTVLTLTSANAMEVSGAIVEEVHTLSGTSVALDPSNGTIQTHTLTGNTTYTESLNDGFSMTLMIAPTANTITWPAMNWVNNETLPPELGTTGNTVVSIWQVGGTVYGAFVGNSEA